MRALILVSAVLVSGTALEGTETAETDVPEFPTVVTFDFDGDGTEDRAELRLSSQPGYADLVIETAAGVQEFPQIVFSGPAAGQEASLAIGTDGTLQVTSGNLSIGRDRWDQTLIIAWKDDAFHLVGATRSWWDALTTSSDGNCEIDFQTGTGLANSSEGARELALDGAAPALAEWDGELPAACQG